MRFLSFGAWLVRINRADSGSFLRLLLRAQEIQEHDESMSAAFRAGLRVGLAHPEIARAVVKEEQ